MTTEKIKKILEQTAYVRTGGTLEELRCARYIQTLLEELGLESTLMPFPVELSEVHEAVLEADGEAIPCTGYANCGSGEVTGELKYLPNNDPASLADCKGKIVLIDGGMGRWMFKDLTDNGALGFITYSGDITQPHEDIDCKELRAQVREDKKLLGVNINAKAAMRLLEKGTREVRLRVEQTEAMGESHNVILEMPGELPETVVFTAHYDSVALSQGSYDNMTGSIGLLALAEHYANTPHRHSLRFIWCGSEERGLLGAKAYVGERESELEKIVLNINLDMIGSIMGKFLACSTAEEKLVHYISYLAAQEGVGIHSYQDVYSSDSTPFADKGIPAVSFARMGSPAVAPFHNRYDTPAILSPRQIEADIAFIRTFADSMVNAHHMPVARTMPDNMKEKLDIYLLRKRKQ